MKFIIKRDILLESLNHTSKAISSKNLIPILSGIKFELKEEGLYLYASDTDISIKSFIPNDKIEEIKELGSVVISGKYIVEIIRKLPDTDISIEVLDGYKMLISTSNTEFNLNGINPNEFPNLDKNIIFLYLNNTLLVNICIYILSSSSANILDNSNKFLPGITILTSLSIFVSISISFLLNL